LLVVGMVTGDLEAEAGAPAIVTLQVAARVAAMNPNMRVVRIDGAGHSIRRMRFQEFAQAVTAFLAEVYWLSRS
jgi:pimeloyl-ACP methyl ester carboxylesterase